MRSQLLCGSIAAVTGLVLAAFLLTMALPVKADQSPLPAGKGKRPKICLVLSGGGARGKADQFKV